LPLFSLDEQEMAAAAGPATRERAASGATAPRELELAPASLSTASSGSPEEFSPGGSSVTARERTAKDFFTSSAAEAADPQAAGRAASGVRKRTTSRAIAPFENDLSPRKLPVTSTLYISPTVKEDAEKSGSRSSSVSVRGRSSSNLSSSSSLPTCTSLLYLSILIITGLLISAALFRLVVHTDAGSHPAPALEDLLVPLAHAEFELGDPAGMGGYFFGVSLHAASYSGNLGLVSSLVGARINLEAQTSRGHTALVLACTKGHVEVVRELLRAGANVRAHNREGWTALHAAIDFPDVVGELLAWGANAKAADITGATPLDYIKSRDVWDALEGFLAH
jgi:hypothetical protein